MKESELYVPVRDWLRSRGYVVHVEIFDCDVVGINESGHMVAVELKVGMRVELCQQLMARASWADEVWAAVPPTADKPFPSFSYNGWGVLIVKPDRVKVQRKARPQPWGWYQNRQYRRKVLLSRHPARDCDIAGLPSCALAKEQRDISRQPRTTGASDDQ